MTITITVFHIMITAAILGAAFTFRHLDNKRKADVLAAKAGGALFTLQTIVAERADIDVATTSRVLKAVRSVPEYLWVLENTPVAANDDSLDKI